MGSSLSTASLMHRDGQYINRYQELKAIDHMREFESINQVNWRLSLRKGSEDCLN